eukprot:GEMP01051485.1.p1 GENE.GEMP01051485.1~~GEMP01051485.1.p1  ORF type:complete len:384 (+),score=51.47 GEMP01051485.1:198-1349(+)
MLVDTDSFILGTPQKLQFSKAAYDDSEIPHDDVGRNDEGRVLIIYTGGTMGMTEGPNGDLRPDADFLRGCLESMSELQQNNIPICSLIQFRTLIDSSDIEPKDWTELASLVSKYYYEFDGFVIIHGTDTMAYTASALSFVLENLGKPVILTGSQLPLTLPHSDAKRNLIHAIMFALMPICEVCVCFNNQLYRGNRSFKHDSRSFNGFSSPNFPPLATVGVTISLRDDIMLQNPRGRFRVHLEPLEAKIVVLYVVPGFDFSFLRQLSGCRAVIFVLYGCGNAPQRKKDLIEGIEVLSKTCILVACSQCPSGEVNLEKYQVGQAMNTAGVISVLDMTIEATITKLYYLFSQKFTKEQIAAEMKKNLRGELSSGSHLLGTSPGSKL